MAGFKTHRFGSIDVPDHEQIGFSRGLLGFEGLKRFVRLDIAEEAPFGWLQSLDDPNVAFVVANPAIFFPDYKIDIDPRELGDVRPRANERLEILGICTVPEQADQVSMNLLGPLVINTATLKGKQLVLNRSGYKTQHGLSDAATASAASLLRESSGRPRAVRARA